MNPKEYFVGINHFSYTVLFVVSDVYISFYGDVEIGDRVLKIQRILLDRFKYSDQVKNFNYPEQDITHTAQLIISNIRTILLTKLNMENVK